MLSRSVSGDGDAMYIRGLGYNLTTCYDWQNLLNSPLLAFVSECFKRCVVQIMGIL